MSKVFLGLSLFALTLWVQCSSGVFSQTQVQTSREIAKAMKAEADALWAKLTEAEEAVSKGKEILTDPAKVREKAVREIESHIARAKALAEEFNTGAKLNATLVQAQRVFQERFEQLNASPNPKVKEIAQELLKLRADAELLDKDRKEKHEEAWRQIRQLEANKELLTALIEIDAHARIVAAARTMLDGFGGFIKQAQQFNGKLAEQGQRPVD